MNTEKLEARLVEGTEDLQCMSADDQFTLLKGRSVEILKSKSLLSKLRSSKEEGRSLVVKYGIDPTSRDIHLGHIVALVVARRLQRMGHHLVLVFGDFTALIGDPTGIVSNRPVLDERIIRDNVSFYTEQVAKIVDINEAEVVFNSSFYEGMSLGELISIYRKIKIQPILQRDDFRLRMEGLTIAEALYPTFMAIDSIRIKPDLELGGKDQLLNFQTAIAAMEAEGLEGESALTTELLQGIAGDGSKMSKSKRNYIALNDPPEEVFGKVMSIPDDLIEHYFKLLTIISDEEWTELQEMMAAGDLSPMVVKRMLARVIVSILHDRETGLKADEKFVRFFCNHQPPEDIPVFEAEANVSIIDALVESKVLKTRSEVRRLIDQGGLSIIVEGNQVKISDHKTVLTAAETLVKVGKRHYLRIRTKPK